MIRRQERSEYENGWSRSTVEPGGASGVRAAFELQEAVVLVLSGAYIGLGFAATLAVRDREGESLKFIVVERAEFSEGRIVGRGRATEEAAERLARSVPWAEAGTPAPATSAPCAPDPSGSSSTTTWMRWRR
ncbi:MAG TPA: hypothetical protein VK869_08580 [Rubrobacteraceae bacterium]|nr:hypothetical protein [Rubrobacteraceae bacterium]